MVKKLWAFLNIVSLLKVAASIDVIRVNESIEDGQTIVSAGESFEMGFFGGSSTRRYLGIWYKKVATGTVVWVANRDNPIEDNHSGVFKLTRQGNLILLNSTGEIIWSSNSLETPIKSPIARLLDTGNLVVMDANYNSQKAIFLWQSFDYPTDTLLPRMKLGFDKRTGLNQYLTSRKSKDDPARGDVSLGLDPNGYPQFILRNGSGVRLRIGPWNGLAFSGQPIMQPQTIFKMSFFFDQDEAYYSFELVNKSVVMRLTVSQNGFSHIWAWADPTRGWMRYLSAPSDNCDMFGQCGANGKCNLGNFPLCDCLDKFVPKEPENWRRAEWSDGCVRRVALDCRSGDGFQRYSGIKMPDTRGSWFDENMTLEECRTLCHKNCSCTAYANLDVKFGGSGCLLWFNDLIDIRSSFQEDGQVLFVRVALSELGTSQFVPVRKKRMTVVISLTILSALLLLVVSLIFYSQRKKINIPKLNKTGRVMHYSQLGLIKEVEEEDLHLPLFDFDTIAEGTMDFSSANKLGEGGFGPVYKGVLKDGQEIAVKRLSKNSSQGLDEFKNEVIFIAKLQHRNLVKLLGYCIHEAEKLLIYEYMPNKSLDSFIFDDTQNRMLDWPKRFCIINGIARGLLYLHQDSRLKIIHRDLKASNILLDEELTPKIADFGMARRFGKDQTEADTKKVVGTYGYISPEYAMNGRFSMKSDVFSFGVLALEIISGKRNRNFQHEHHHHNLLGHAWKLFKIGRPLELVDEAMQMSSHTSSQIIRSIHVALLCVQSFPDDRPSMSSVVLMFGSDTTLLPQPKQPGFFTDRLSPFETANASNEVTITLLEGR